jgi:hypothetical protein
MEKILLIIIFAIFIIVLTDKNNKPEHPTSQTLTYYQCKHGDSTTKLFRDALETNHFTRSNDEQEWDLLIPCNSKFNEKEFKKINTINNNQLVSYVSNNAILGSKYNIWNNLEKYLGRDVSCNVMPPSYVFPKDLTLFKKEFDENKYYVLKSEKQRQEGLKLSNNYDEIINSKESGYKVVQEFIDNPLMLNNYKINFRVYLLVICDPKISTKKSYYFDDGIISYAKTQYPTEINKMTFDSAVSSFYTSKELYNSGFPLILSELKLIMKWIDWDDVDNLFKSKIELMLTGAYPKICSYELKHRNKTFQLFGVDFMIIKNQKLSKLDARILEVNVGPGMDPYCERDRIMREKLHSDMLDIVLNKSIGINNGFNLIL